VRVWQTRRREVVRSRLATIFVATGGINFSTPSARELTLGTEAADRRVWCCRNSDRERKLALECGGLPPL